MISCHDGSSRTVQNKFLDRRYEGYWAETLWTYEFKPDGKFIFTSEGHYGNVADYGVYLVQDSLLILTPRTDWRVLSGVLKTKLRIMSENCIRDFDSNFYCLPIDSTYRYTDEEFVFQDRVIGFMDTLQIVRKEKDRIATNHLGHEAFDLEIDFDGIIMIDGKEFQAFHLSTYDNIEGRRNYLTFLA